MIIETMKELQALADLYGFNLEFDNDGQVILYTGLAMNRNSPVAPENELVPLECVNGENSNGRCV